MSRAAAALLALALSGCVSPGILPHDAEPLPAADDWSPRRSEVEWWYVAASSPESGLAFHVAFFRAHPPPGLRVLGLEARALRPGVAHVAHVAVTDLATGARCFEERWDVPFGGGGSAARPLRVHVAGWWLAETAGGGVHVEAGPLVLDVAPGKPRSYLLPSGTRDAGTGVAHYQSSTRSPYRGTLRGRPIAGEAWSDHQWGDLLPGTTARWDWHGLHLASGDDVMLYDVTRMDGGGRVVGGTRTDPWGAVHALEGLTIEATGCVSEGPRRTYDVGFRVRAQGLDLTIAPVFPREECRSATTRIDYWEGPVEVHGTLDGRPVTGVGMGEHLPRPRAGPRRPPRPPAPTSPPRARAGSR